MNAALARTPLHDWHAAHQGRIVEFSGWSMPVQYTSIVAEHTATRTAAGMFDVSHMGRLRFSGSGAGMFLDRLLTRRATDMAAGRIRYSLILNEQGGVLDDVLVYRLSEPEAENDYRLVVNAGNRPKIIDWVEQHLADDVAFEDLTEQTAMIAVQGPEALATVAPLVSGADLASFKYYTGGCGEIEGARVFVSRTGYTGEDGCELIVPAECAVEVWSKILALGQPKGALPAGLGARDTLRLEAAMPLYGHELSETINPVQAGLRFAVNLDRDFIGRDAVAAVWDDPSQPRRIGLELAGRRAAREGYSVFAGDQQIGEVTSGAFSPTLQRAIAMAYVQPSHAELGAKLQVDIRGRREEATAVKLPFYTRTKNR